MDNIPYIAVIDLSNGTLCGIVDEYQSLVTRSVLNGIGQWSVTLPVTQSAIAIMRTGRMISVDGFDGLIEDISIEQMDDADVMTVSGSDLGVLLGARLALPAQGQEYAQYSGNASQVMAQMIVDNCIDAEDAARNYPQLSIGLVENALTSATYQARYERLSDALGEIATAHGLVWHVMHAGKGLLAVDILQGRDHSATSVVPVIYAPDFDNVSGQSYVRGISGSANVALAAGNGEGAEREVCWVGDGASGLDRREVCLTLRKYADLALEAAQQLAEGYCPTLAFTGTLLEAGPYRYGEDWGLGDIITVQHLGWGVSMDVRVSEVERVYEGDVARINAVFGDARITVVDAIKRAMSPLESDARR